VDIVGSIGNLDKFDLFVGLFLFAMFVLGYIQGTIRRVVGTLSITFAFFLAAALQGPFGDFLASNWVNYPKEYSHMLGFGTIFVAAVLALFLVVQGTYSKTEIFARYPVVDEVLGGVLGVAQGLLLLLFVTIILDQYFMYAGLASGFSEVPFIRSFWTSLNDSSFGALLHLQVIPNFLAITSFLVPASIRATYGV
jgi:uncharacterized membrane protein required for colicin V production